MRFVSYRPSVYRVTHPRIKVRLPIINQGGLGIWFQSTNSTRIEILFAKHWQSFWIQNVEFRYIRYVSTWCGIRVNRTRISAHETLFNVVAVQVRARWARPLPFWRGFLPFPTHPTAGS